MLPSQQTLHNGLPQSLSAAHCVHRAGSERHIPLTQPELVHTLVPSGQFAHVGARQSAGPWQLGPPCAPHATPVLLPQTPLEQCNWLHARLPSRHTVQAGAGQSASDRHCVHDIGSLTHAPFRHCVAGQTVEPSGQVPQLAGAQSRSAVHRPLACPPAPSPPVPVPPPVPAGLSVPLQASVTRATNDHMWGNERAIPQLAAISVPLPGSPTRADSEPGIGTFGTDPDIRVRARKRERFTGTR